MVISPVLKCIAGWCTDMVAEATIMYALSSFLQFRKKGHTPGPNRDCTVYSKSGWG